MANDRDYWTGGDREVPDISADQARDLENWFTYHPPKNGDVEVYQTIRDIGRDLAETIAANTPTSREQSLAITKVREAVMWANAARACNAD